MKKRVLALVLVMAASFCLGACGSKEPTVEEVVEASGLPEKTVMAAIQAMYTTVSFDTKVGEDGESTLEDFLALVVYFIFVSFSASKSSDFYLPFIENLFFK